MDLRPYIELVRDLLAAMGQDLGAARPVPEGFALRTQDGYLYVFVIDGDRGSVESVRRWCEEANVPRERLVVFSLRALPSHWGPTIEQHGGLTVQGATLERLVRELDIDTPLVAPETPGRRGSATSLPSVRGLEAEMHRAEIWYASGVLPLALRFYRAAAALKPEYSPALRGVARSLSVVGPPSEARAAWERVLELAPGDLEARVGHAVSIGALGDRAHEVAVLRSLAREAPDSNEVHVALFAALVERSDWKGAREEISRLLDHNPRDPRLRLLHSEVLARTGMVDAAADELRAAERLGLSLAEANRLRAMIDRRDSPLDDSLVEGKAL
ncbi:MAG: hypothetical protein ACREB9_05340 [Thermoplasmata archaeon]